MTIAPVTPPLPISTLDSALEAMRTRGLRISAARRLVLEALFAAKRPLPAGEISGGLGGRLPRSDLASVYRNLETLERIGLVRHFHAGHGAGHYALASDAEREFVVCEWCGTLEALAPAAVAPIRDGIRAACGFEARFSHFPIVGLCPRCVERAGESDTTDDQGAAAAVPRHDGGRSDVRSR